MVDKIKDLIKVIEPFVKECERVKCNYLRCNPEVREKCLKATKYSYMCPMEMKRFLSNIDKVENILK